MTSVATNLSNFEDYIERVRANAQNMGTEGDYEKRKIKEENAKDFDDKINQLTTKCNALGLSKECDIKIQIEAFTKEWADGKITLVKDIRDRLDRIKQIVHRHLPQSAAAQPPAPQPITPEAQNIAIAVANSNQLYAAIHEQESTQRALNENRQTLYLFHRTRRLLEPTDEDVATCSGAWNQTIPAVAVLYAMRCGDDVPEFLTNTTKVLTSRLQKKTEEAEATIERNIKNAEERAKKLDQLHIETAKELSKYEQIEKELQKVKTEIEKGTIGDIPNEIFELLVKELSGKTLSDSERKQIFFFKDQLSAIRNAVEIFHTYDRELFNKLMQMSYVNHEIRIDVCIHTQKCNYQIKVSRCCKSVAINPNSKNLLQFKSLMNNPEFQSLEGEEVLSLKRWLWISDDHFFQKYFAHTPLQTQYKVAVADASNTFKNVENAIKENDFKEVVRILTSPLFHLMPIERIFTFTNLKFPSREFIQLVTNPKFYNKSMTCFLVSFTCAIDLELDTYIDTLLKNDKFQKLDQFPYIPLFIRAIQKKSKHIEHFFNHPQYLKTTNADIAFYIKKAIEVKADAILDRLLIHLNISHILSTGEFSEKDWQIFFTKRAVIVHLRAILRAIFGREKPEKIEYLGNTLMHGGKEQPIYFLFEGIIGSPIAKELLSHDIADILTFIYMKIDYYKANDHRNMVPYVQLWLERLQYFGLLNHPSATINPEPITKVIAKRKVCDWRAEFDYIVNSPIFKELLTPAFVDELKSHLLRDDFDFKLIKDNRTIETLLDFALVHNAPELMRKLLPHYKTSLLHPGSYVKWFHYQNIAYAPQS